MKEDLENFDEYVNYTDEELEEFAKDGVITHDPVIVEKLNAIMVECGFNEDGSLKKINEDKYHITGRQVAEMVGLVDIYDKYKKP